MDRDIGVYFKKEASVQFSSVSPLCPTLCDPMLRKPVYDNIEAETLKNENDLTM